MEEFKIKNEIKNHAATFKQRLIFYPSFLGLSAFIGFLPLIPPLLAGSLNNMGMAGLIYFFFWWAIGIIDIIFIFIYEFTHLPNKENIDFRIQKKISLIYLILGTLSLVYFLLTSILLILMGAKISIYFFIALSPFLALVIFDLWHYITACKLQSISRKLAIITTLSTLTLVVGLFFFIPESIKSYYYIKNGNMFSAAVSNNDLKACLEVKSDVICKKTLAIKNGDTDLCLAINDDREEALCLYEVAKNTKNEVICDKLMDNLYVSKANCQLDVLAINKKELVNDLSDLEIFDKALADNSFDVCLALDDISDRQECQLKVAKQNNITYCEKIQRITFGNIKPMFDCYAFYEHELSEKYLNNYDDADKDSIYDYIEREIWQTDPNNADTDGDGYYDGNEVKSGHDPLQVGASISTAPESVVMIEYDKNFICPNFYNLSSKSEVAHWVQTIQRCNKFNPFSGHCLYPNISQDLMNGKWKISCDLTKFNLGRVVVDLDVDGMSYQSHTE